ATAGDLITRDVVAGWLEAAGRPYDVANDPPFAGGVDWRRAHPAVYDEVVFVCGPFYAHRRVVEGLPRPAGPVLVRVERALRFWRGNPLRRYALDLMVHRFRG